MGSEIKDICNTKDMISNSLECQFRAEEMLCVLQNRIDYFKQLSGSTPDLRIAIKAYEDCVDILKKEFLTLDYSYIDFYLEEIKKYRDEVVERINPLEQYRGTKEYNKQLKFNGRFADAIENIAVKMYGLGRKNR